MPNILISTSCRYTSLNEPSGRLLLYDLEKRKVVQSCEILEPPYREKDPNPRGGFRGLKGISINRDLIAIANSSTIFIYDYLWNPVTYLWHPTCAGIHDIKLLDESVWVTCSRNDLLICLDFNGNIDQYYDLRKNINFDKLSSVKIKPFLHEKEIIMGKINFRDPSTHDGAFTDLLHVNSLAIQNSGDILVSCGLFRIVDNLLLHKIHNHLLNSFLSDKLPSLKHLYNRLTSNKNVVKSTHPPITKKKTSSLLLKLTPKGEWSKSLIVNECTVPSHSIRILKDYSAIYLDSTSGKLIQFNPSNGQEISSHKLGNTFLRGAKELDDGSILLGDNNDIIHFDLANKKVLSRIKITENPAEAVFDIDVMPNFFGFPPKSFIDLHNEKHPVVQQ